LGRPDVLEEAQRRAAQEDVRISSVLNHGEFMKLVQIIKEIKIAEDNKGETTDVYAQAGRIFQEIMDSTGASSEEVGEVLHRYLGDPHQQALVNILNQAKEDIEL